jgi:phosphoesterase RecJ-like protein
MNNVHLSRITDTLKSRSRFIIFAHVDPDIDAIGSCLALAHQLKAQGKRAAICVAEELGHGFDFLPGIDTILVNTLPDFDHECVIALDSCTYDRVAGLNVLTDKSIDINIDHHVANTEFGAMNYVSEYSSVGETLTHLFQSLNWTISQDMATCLYAAICYDTGRFNHSNVTLSTLRAAATLIETGMAPYAVTHAMYEKVPKDAFELMKIALDNLVISERYTYTIIPKTAPVCDFKVVDFIRQMDGPEIVIVFQELESDIKVNLRSKGERDVVTIAAQFGGGGHRKASGIRFTDTPLDDVISTVCTAIEGNE